MFFQQTPQLWCSVRSHSLLSKALMHCLAEQHQEIPVVGSSVNGCHTRFPPASAWEWQTKEAKAAAKDVPRCTAQIENLRHVVYFVYSAGALVTLECLHTCKKNEKKQLTKSSTHTPICFKVLVKIFFGNAFMNVFLFFLIFALLKAILNDIFVLFEV